MTMATDTGVIGCGNRSTGRWIEDQKDGRKRNLHIYLADNGDNSKDQSYIGYFHDLNKPVHGCNFAIAIGKDVVTIQTVKPGSDSVSIKDVPVSQFMDILDLLVS